MKRNFAFFAVVLFVMACLSTISFAQNKQGRSARTAVFKGKVLRSDTGKGVAGVQILLMDKKKSDKQDNSVESETDEDGNFIFSEVAAGKYTVSIKAIFDREEDVPCQLLLGKIDEPNSKLVVLTDDDGKKIEQIFIDGFSVKAGKEINKTFDLVCKSLFGE